MRRDFRKALRDEIKFRNITLKELTALSGVPIASINTYVGKQGSMPPVDTADKLARALGVTVEYLLYGKAESKGIVKATPDKATLLKLFDALTSEDKKIAYEMLMVLKKARDGAKKDAPN